MNTYLKEFKTHADYLEAVRTEGIEIPNISICDNEPNKAHYNPEVNEPLKFTAVESGSISIVKNGKSELNLYKSADKEHWSEWNGNDIPLAEGEYVYVRGKNFNGLNNEGSIKFAMSGAIKCEGNIMSLLGKFIKEIPCIYCFQSLFEDCASLIQAPDLPATKLTSFCYRLMFSGCTSLETAPELPAMLLDTGCYNEMFNGCTSLVNAPELPSLVWAEFCYTGMFINCTNLETAPVLPAPEIGQNCYNNMFKGCSKLNYIKAMFLNEPSDDATMDWVEGVSENGTFVKSPLAEWDARGINAVPENWTIII